METDGDTTKVVVSTVAPELTLMVCVPRAASGIVSVALKAPFDPVVTDAGAVATAALSKANTTAALGGKPRPLRMGCAPTAPESVVLLTAAVMVKDAPSVPWPSLNTTV